VNARVLPIVIRLFGVTLALNAGAGHAQPAEQTPSSAVSQQREGQHDFEFGAWGTHLRRLLRPLTGTATWLEYDGTTVVDGPAGHFEGLSLRLYDPQSHQRSLNFSGLGSGSMSTPAIGQFRNGRGSLTKRL
jgi:hypothetical protein